MTDRLTGKPRPRYARAVEEASVVRAMSREIDRLDVIEEAARAYVEWTTGDGHENDGEGRWERLLAALEGAPHDTE